MLCNLESRDDYFGVLFLWYDNQKQTIQMFLLDEHALEILETVMAYMVFNGNKIKKMIKQLHLIIFIQTGIKRTLV